jgi:hypothetical protein
MKQHTKCEECKGGMPEVKMVGWIPDLLFGLLQQMIWTIITVLSGKQDLHQKTAERKGNLFSFLTFLTHLSMGNIAVYWTNSDKELYNDNLFCYNQSEVFTSVHKDKNAVQNEFQYTVLLKAWCKVYYPSWHNILKDIYRRLFKDNDLIWLLDDFMVQHQATKETVLGITFTVQWKLLLSSLTTGWKKWRVYKYFTR